MASLGREVNRLHALADELLVVVQDSETLELKYQKLICETALLRLFYSLEGTLMTMAFKLLCNSSYADGTKAALMVAPFRGMATAEGAVLAAARGRGVRFLKWTQFADFQRNLAPFMPVTEHLVAQRQLHDNVFEDMRKVRNHIAHGTRSTASQFGSVVAAVYTSHPRGVSPAKLLLSTRTAFTGAPTTGRPRIIEQYIRWAKLAVKVIGKA